LSNYLITSQKYPIEAARISGINPKPYCLICERVTHILMYERHRDEEHCESKANKKEDVDQVHHQPG
jgi:hypothetical protein